MSSRISQKFAARKAAYKGRTKSDPLAVARTYRRTVIPRSLPQTINMQVARAIQRNTEQKYVDVPFVTSSTDVTTNLTTNAMIYPMNLVQQGVDQFKRVGNKITLQSLKVELRFTHSMSQDPGTANSINGNNLRITIFWDREGGGTTTPAWNSIFANIYEDGSSSSMQNSGVVPYQKQRYLLLHDEVITSNPCIYNFTVPGPTDPATVPVVAQSQIVFRKFIDLSKKKLVTVFSGTANPMTTANVATGILYCAIRATHETSPNVNVIDLKPYFGSRLRFTDS